ncbi:MAG TPA: hypothetical protein PK808_11275, partial [Polymorphobacter sp.]|nr:hypothetical protein [Polymorphobacter sp.]
SASAFYDGGAAFTMGVARASLAALRANVPAAGAVDYCLDAGGLMLARPWTTPVYPFTADMIVGDPKAANIASAVVSSRTALAFKAGVVAAFNGVQAADCGLYVADTKTIAEVLDQIFAGLGAWWKLTSAGEIDIRQFGYAGAALRTFGRWTRGHVTRKEFVMPTRRRSLGYKPNWRVHGENEIAKSLLLTASDVKYADGTLIEALKPAQAAADVTAQQQIVVTVPALVTYGADASGTIVGTITSESIRVARGGASIKLDNGTSYAITPLGGITGATVDNVNGSVTKGDITGITFGGNTGTIEVVVTVGGVAQPKQIIQFSKDIAAPPATGGSGSKTASDTSLGYCSATTDTVLSDTLTVTIASGESLYGTAPLDFEIDGTTTATRSASCKWQYFAASTWNDFIAGT